jgi:hypothetical protein
MGRRLPDAEQLHNIRESIRSHSTIINAGCEFIYTPLDCMRARNAMSSRDRRDLAANGVIDPE